MDKIIVAAIVAVFLGGAAFGGSFGYFVSGRSIETGLTNYPGLEKADLRFINTCMYLAEKAMAEEGE